MYWRHYFYGFGVLPNLEKAIEFYVESAELKHTKEMMNLENIFRKTDLELALYWLEQATNLKYT